VLSEWSQNAPYRSRIADHSHLENKEKLPYLLTHLTGLSERFQIILTN